MEELIVEKWLSIEYSIQGNDGGYSSGYGDGLGGGSASGCGNGFGYGLGGGSASGCGDGSGHGRGSASGFGLGRGSASGYGFGGGSASGCGDGSGSASGYGDGIGGGPGLKMFNDMMIFVVDDISTIITNIKGNLAKGFILQADLTLTPCFIVKGCGHFAHGETVKNARKSLQKKIFETMDTDETIDKFIEIFNPNKKYAAKDFYEWHHYLTGSCEMGRKSFMKDHDIDFDTDLTVDEFIDLCKEEYGAEIIKQLEEKYIELKIKK